MAAHSLNGGGKQKVCLEPRTQTPLWTRGLCWGGGLFWISLLLGTGMGMLWETWASAQVPAGQGVANEVSSPKKLSLSSEPVPEAPRVDPELGRLPAEGPMTPGPALPDPTESVSPGGSEEMVVEVRVIGREYVSWSKLAPLIRTRAGRPLDMELIEEDVRRLNRSRLFMSVKTWTQAVPGGRVVIFEVVERPVLHYVKFVGNEKVRKKVLAEKAELKPGDAMDPFAVEEGRRKIEDYYHSHGFSNVRVTIIEGSKPDDKGAIYLINEGKKQRFLWTRFEGNTVATDARLRTQIHSKPGFLWIFRGQVDRKEIDEDINRLKAYYASLGYFNAKIGREVEYNAEKNWITLTFVIDEGPRYQVREVRFIGNERFSADELNEATKLKSGQYFNQSQLQSDVAALQEKYGALGYVFADIKPDIRYLPEPGQADLVYEIKEGDRYRVSKIDVKIGSEEVSPHTKITTVLNRLSLAPGDVVDIRELRASERRLRASGLFLIDPVRGFQPKIVFSPPEVSDEEVEVARPPKRQPAVRGQSPSPSSESLEPATPAQGDRFGVLSVYGQLSPEGIAFLQQQEQQATNPGQSQEGHRPDSHGIQKDVGSVRGQMPWLPPPVLGRPGAVPPTRAGWWPVLWGSKPSGPRTALEKTELPTRSDNNLVVRAQSPTWGEPGSRVIPTLPLERPLPGMERFYQIGSSQQQVQAGSAAAGPSTAGSANGTSASGYPTDSSTPGYANVSSPGYGVGSSAAGNTTGSDRSVVGVVPGGDGASASGYVRAPGSGGANGAGAAFPSIPQQPETPGPFRRWIDEHFLGDGAPGGGILGGRGGVVSGLPPGEELPAEPLRPLPLEVITEESRTGRIMLGVGITSDAGLVGSVIIDEQNFDIFRFPHSWEEIRNGTAWRGAGQRFRVEAVPGTEVHRYAVSFTEPYFLNTEISTGLSGYFFRRNYEDWDEERVGGTVRVGYQLRPDLTTTFTFRGEKVTLYDPHVSPGVVPDLDAALGANELFGFRIGLAYDTRDSAFLPTEGHYIDFGFEQVIGSFDYPRGDFEIRKYFTLHQRADGSGRHVLSVGFSFAVTGEETPIYDHYFAGGFSTLRGFDYRGADPHIAGVSVGGHMQLLGSAQYLFPITADDMLRAVVFCDFGTVEEDYTLRDENFRVSLGFGLRLLVPAMGPAPLAFDFAWPVAKADGDVTEVFSFFIGLGR